VTPPAIVSRRDSVCFRTGFSGCMFFIPTDLTGATAYQVGY
jgi:hypothetical protein